MHSLGLSNSMLNESIIPTLMDSVYGLSEEAFDDLLMALNDYDLTSPHYDLFPHLFLEKTGVIYDSLAAKMMIQDYFKSEKERGEISKATLLFIIQNCVPYLKDLKILNLNFSCAAYLTSFELKQIVESCPLVEVFSWQGNREKRAIIEINLNPLLQLKNLKELHLYNMRLTPDQVLILNQLSLEKLNFSGCHFTDSDLILSFITPIKSLHTLGLKDVNINEQQKMELRKWTQLKSLDLGESAAIESNLSYLNSLPLVQMTDINKVLEECRERSQAPSAPTTKLSNWLAIDEDYIRA